MNGPPAPSLADVHRTLIERIGSGVYPVGARLPTCRALAADLGSNASTIDRAVQRLADAGLVRTLPRRGSFVVALPRERGLTVDTLGAELGRLLGRARRAGLAPFEIRARVDEALAVLDSTPRVALVECNGPDLERLRRLVENASGVAVQPVLLQDLPGRRLDREFDVVAAPLFHLHDLADAVEDLDTVVEINVAVAPSVLRRLATLEPGTTVAVATPTVRGVHRITALVRQYYSGPVTGYQLGVDAPDVLAGADVLVRTNAGPITEAELGAVSEVLQIEWALEPGFAGDFRARVQRELDRATQAQHDASIGG